MITNLNFITTNINQDKSLKATPPNICKDMVELFQPNQFDNKHIFADLYCKTGNLLQAVKNRGVSASNLIAICDNKQSQMLICRQLYGQLYNEEDCSTEINTITRRKQVYYIKEYKNIVKNYNQKYIADIFRIIKEHFMRERERVYNFMRNLE